MVEGPIIALEKIRMQSRVTGVLVLRVTVQNHFPVVSRPTIFKGRGRERKGEKERGGEGEGGREREERRRYVKEGV